MAALRVCVTPTHALCNPVLKRECYGKHAAGCIPVHKVHVGIKKKERGSPRLAERDRARGLHADAPASDPAPTARRRI